MMRYSLLVAALLAGAAHAQTVERVSTAPALVRLPSRVAGRVVAGADGSVKRQWPGTYLETAFRGSGLFFRLGPGEVSLRISVDGAAPRPLVKPAPGLYRIAGLTAGPHRVRIDVASESQAGPTSLGGFLAAPGTVPAPIPSRRRQIEFIGDSHTVGYGDTSPVRGCTQDEVWTTTDTTRGLAALVARRFDADYQVNAISGRGVVRNYDGHRAATLPEAYPFALFDMTHRAIDPGWHPQVIVIALGTNDFSTPLHPGERWRTREELHADYEASYRRFLTALRARHPSALILLWATDMAGGEIEAETGKVAAQLRQAGDAAVDYVPIDGLAFSACDSHPGLADHARIADALSARIAASGSLGR